MNLRRSNDDYRIAGVCGGLAEYLGWDSSRVRIVWVLATIFSAAFPGVILYLALWYLMPEEPPPAPTFEPPPMQPWKKSF
jgi:phage shock protein PspC (stress-responsive transcriptional regulator)